MSSLKLVVKSFTTTTLKNQCAKSPPLNKLITSFAFGYLTNFHKITTLDDAFDHYAKVLKYFTSIDPAAKLLFYVGSIDKVPVCVMILIHMNEAFLTTINKRSLEENRASLDLKQKSKITYGINLFVAPFARKKGICKEFLGELTTIATAAKSDYFITDINDHNIPSIKCHAYNKFVKKIPSFYKDSYLYLRNLSE